ncbi:MAG: hypothetical protein M3O31_14535 [Acidobacteriota bacterium]|nr:hypothetical protein [Acidobacteriota bacterium]
MRTLQLLAFIGLMLGTSESGWSQKPVVSPIVDVHQATVVAFYMPALRSKSVDADDNESLQDFRLYAARVKDPLAKAGIRFEELYVGSFRIRLGSKTQVFHSTSGVGYYLVAPGKKPHVEYGVMTDTDLLVAKQFRHRNPTKLAAIVLGSPKVGFSVK